MNHVTEVMLVTIAQTEAEVPGILELITEADIIVQFVLFVLLGMSVACWVIIFNKFTRIRRAEARTQAFLKEFWAAARLD